MIDVVSGEVVNRLQRPEDCEGSNLVYSKCGRFVVHGSWDGRLMIDEPSTGRMAFVRDFPEDLIRQVIHLPADDKWVVVHSPKATSDTIRAPADYLTVWTWPLAEPSTRVALELKNVNAASLSPDGPDDCHSG